MKESKRLEQLLLERDRSVAELRKAVSAEKLYLHEKRFDPLIRSLDDIKKYHQKVDHKINDMIGILKEIETILEELEL